MVPIGHPHSWLTARFKRLVFAALLVFGTAPSHAIAAKRCPGQSVAVGDACIDRYEASLWRVPSTNRSLLNRILRGTATQADLLAGGATQLGVSMNDYGATCPDTAEGCVDIYAISLPGVLPSRFMSWPQAATACRNSGKRLMSNEEWQVAALGTPDPGLGGGDGATACKTDDASIPPAGSPVLTGNAPSCVSDVGIFDMLGNVWEWTGAVQMGASAYGLSAISRGGAFHDIGASVFLTALVPDAFADQYGFFDTGTRCAQARP